MVKPIELFLLSQMRFGGTKVDEALRMTGVSRSQMERVAQELIGRYGLGESSHSADVYDELIGAPDEEKAVKDVPSAFAGSTSRRYRLPTWPLVWFVVNRDVQGRAWGWGFEKDVLSKEGFLPQSVRPWEWTSGSLKELADQVETVDTWSTDEDLRLRFGRLVYRAQFDWRLLQTWTLESTTPT